MEMSRKIRPADGLHRVIMHPALHGRYWTLSFAVTPTRISITTRALVSRFNNDIIMGPTVIDAVVPLSVAPPWRALSPSLRQNLIGVVSGGSTVMAFGVRITRWAFFTGFLNVGVSDCRGVEND